MDINKYKNYKIKIIENANNSKLDYLFSKILVVGDCKVGKSSLIKRITSNKFDPNYKPTKGYEFYNYMVKIDDTYVKLQVWDMCGDEKYLPALLNLYRNASIGILVYSINDYNSFQNLDTWITQLKKNAPVNNKIILIGNKSDEDGNKEVTYDDGKKICQKYNLELFMEVSAKDGIQSPNFLEIAAVNIYEEHLQHGDEMDTTNNNESINLGTVSGKQKFRCC
jgi:small GTP-binding protein